MRTTLAMTSNVKRFLGAVKALHERADCEEGMCVLYGEPGEGKTTVVAYTVDQYNGVFLRAQATWTTTSMLQRLCEELGIEPSHRRVSMFDNVVKELNKNPRPIVIDEADYLLRQEEMLDTLRDIYDLVKNPVILVGMEKFARTLRGPKFSRHARRITQVVEFRGLDLGDVVTVAKTLCEVAVADDLLDYVKAETRGNIGRVVIALSKIESYARANRKAQVTLADWGQKPLYFDQPSFRRVTRGE